METKDFIEKSQKIHQNDYDYSLTKYINSHEKVKIICKIHGLFEQRPNNHLGGQGCPQCGGTKKLNLQSFIKRSNDVHEKDYDYSLVDYKNNKTKVKIICRKHGIFEQIPEIHLKGSKCPKCSIEKSRRKNDFLLKSKLKYDNKYDYSLIDYKRGDKKIKIICPIHGIFEQKPKLHLKKGCPVCEKNMIPNTEQIKMIFNEIHDNKYDYSLVKYINDKTKVKIICKNHGIFEQTPGYHKIGNGCPMCNESKGEREISNTLKEKQIRFTRQKKFEDCKDIKNLYFDFYLPHHNMCIEYDGEQHYNANEFFGGVERLKDQRKKDKIKDDYCKLHQINIMRIKFNENIKDRLSFL